MSFDTKAAAGLLAAEMIKHKNPTDALGAGLGLLLKLFSAEIARLDSRLDEAGLPVAGKDADNALRRH